MTLQHFLDLDRIESGALRGIVDNALRMKRSRAPGGKAMPDASSALSGRLLAMVFEKPSLRTRVSFDAAIRQLGGESMILNAGDLQIGRGETIADTARVLSRYVDIIMIRTTKHTILQEMAAAASVPVINGLTDDTHPCQLLADIMTYEERKGPVAGSIWAWSGDGNNVARSMVHAAVQFKFELRLACPPGFEPPAELLRWAVGAGGRVRLTADPGEAASGADCVYTDVWVSIGHQPGNRHNLLRPYQVNESLMAKAKPGALFMHCLPAHRGEEVSAGVIDGPQSVVFDEAENRMHVQKAILRWCLDR